MNRNIKTFESFNNQDYYFEITNNEYNQLKSKLSNIVDINSNIINTIKNRAIVNLDDIRLIEPLIDRKGLYLSYKKRITGDMPPDQHENYLEREYQIWVFELTDEWFIVYYQSKNISGSSFWNNKYFNFKHYKCDQVDGLMKLLNDLNLLK